MKEFILILVFLVIGSSVLISAFADEKFRSSLEALSALVLFVFILNNFSFISFPKKDYLKQTEVSEGNVYESYENSAANVAAEVIKEELRSVLGLRDVDVHVDMTVTKDFSKLNKVDIYCGDDYSLSEILFCTENRFGLQGIVFVHKKEGE